MKLQKISAVLVLLMATGASAPKSSAHRGHAHDWRNDKAAYQSVAVDTRVYATPVNALSSEPLAFEVNPETFRLKLEELTGARDAMIDGKNVRITERGSDAGRKLGRQWLTQEYQKLGFTVSEHNYGRGANVVAEKAGTSGKVLIVSSHMDSVNNAGADDDGSGTIAALLIAQALKDVKLKHTLRVLAFDNEEQGLIGSAAYVKTLSDKSAILGVIQMEMMAFNSRRDGKFHLIDCDVENSAFLTKAIMSAIQANSLPLTRVKACTGASDHSSFWDAKIPAVVLSENFFGGDGDTCYHRRCDIVDDRLDLKYSAQIATSVAIATAQLVGISE